MAYTKRIVCLANSYKRPNGRCFAGREVAGDGFGGWIRPVSARPTAELQFSEYCYANCAMPRLLDIIDVPLLRPDPRYHQPENHVIDAGRWVKAGELPYGTLEQLRDWPGSLWINKEQTKSGAYDCIGRADAVALRNSLLLVKPDQLHVEVARRDGTGKKTCRAAFEYNGVRHNLSLTDPIVRVAFLGKEEGAYPVDRCLRMCEPDRALRG